MDFCPPLETPEQRCDKGIRLPDKLSKVPHAAAGGGAQLCLLSLGKSSAQLLETVLEAAVTSAVASDLLKKRQQ